MRGEAAIQIQPLPEPSPARYLPPAPRDTDLAPRQFLRPISTRWRITSFSGLIADRIDESPDRDPDEPAGPAEPAPATGLFAFPRGTQAGTCLHKIFEELDFTRADDAATLNPLIESNLRRHGIGLEFAEAVAASVRQTLTVPLEPAQAEFTLGRVPAEERMNELEFCLPVRELTPALLRTGLAAAGGDVAARLGALGFRPSEGFIRGFIDLVFRRADRFYLVDWKSNWLGNRAEDYGPAALRSEMVRRFYVLQYHLYTLALHEHLHLRLPGYRYEEHFGGVCYVFLRGIDPARPELGVFRDRPAAATMEHLSRALLAKPDGPG